MNIYFSGLGGVGIGPLAEIARDMGYTVMGSDLAESLTTEELRAQGVPVNIGQDGSFLQACHRETPLDWFVYTAALPSDHPELVLARQLGIRVSKRDEFLAHILKEKDLKLIAVSGTHGKTTTASMLVWVAQQLGVPVSYAVGSTLPFGPNGKYDPASDVFIYECDEFDRNFLHFRPYLSIISSIDYDHPDTYPTEADYIAAFNTFIQHSQYTVMWQQDLDDLSVVQGSSGVLHLIDKDGKRVQQEVASIRLPGLHNRQNAYLVLTAVTDHLDGDREAVKQALDNFPGANRRFEKLADNLYSDYGHHPKEIAATLQLARELSDNVILVYQPHQNRRQHRIRDQYHDQFEPAEQVYWLPTYLSREDPDQAILHPAELFDRLTNRDRVRAADLDDELWATIQQARRDGKLVLGMGAGSIDNWLREKLAS